MIYKCKVVQSDLAWAFELLDIAKAYSSDNVQGPELSLVLDEHCRPALALIWSSREPNRYVALLSLTKKLAQLGYKVTFWEV